MWRVLNVVRRIFPRSFPKVETLVRRGLLWCEIGVVWPMRNLNRPRNFALDEPNWDYLRISNLELAAHEIHQNGIACNVAELGVFH